MLMSLILMLKLKELDRTILMLEMFVLQTGSCEIAQGSY